jgi:drug/metabolite transporter (DMT)-like permease
MYAILLAVAAGVCWGMGELFTRSALHTKQIGPLAAIALRSTIALPLLWLAYFVVARSMQVERTGWLKTAESATLAKVVFGSGIVAGAFGMILFYSALNLAEASRIKPIAFSVAPATAVVLGWLVLHESMTWQKAAGVTLILAGVVLLTGAGAETRNQPAEVHQQPAPR